MSAIHDYTHNSRASASERLRTNLTKLATTLRTSVPARPVDRKAARTKVRMGDLVATGMKAGLSLYGVAILARVFILY